VARRRHCPNSHAAWRRCVVACENQQADRRRFRQTRRRCTRQRSSRCHRFVAAGGRALSTKWTWPGGPGQLPARGSHGPVRARIRAYGSSESRLRGCHYPLARRLTRARSTMPSPCFGQRGHDPVHSLPSTRSGSSVPALPRYYQGTTRPVVPPASLRFLRSAVPRGASVIRSARPQTRGRQPGFLGFGNPPRRISRGDDRWS
jgi:hypothetical protein